MRNRTVLKIFGMVWPIVTYIFSFFFPGRKAAVLASECRNKANIMGLVQNMQSYMDAEGKTPLQTIVEKCYALGNFPALWAVEGAGKDLAEWHIARNPNPQRILIDAQLDPKWDGAWLMLHAGLGLGFAKHFYDHMKEATDEALRHVVRETVRLCRDNSRQGYYGAAIESLGLVTRFMQGTATCLRVHYILEQEAPDSVGFYLARHGALGVLPPHQLHARLPHPGARRRSVPQTGAEPLPARMHDVRGGLGPHRGQHDRPARHGVGPLQS